MTENAKPPSPESSENELKKATSPAVPATPKLCEPCMGIQRNWRRAPGHAELEQGSNRQEDRRQDRYSNHKHSLVTITRYSCARCGTAWEYENNKADQKAGWSVVGR